MAERPNLNTTVLANTLSTSLASVSEHATVLREAGLVITHRRNGFAMHVLSARGTALLARPHREKSA